MAHALADDARPRTRPTFSAVLSSAPADIDAAQRFRYRIFAGELGARVRGAERGLDEDALDAFCRHLLVRDDHSGELVGYSRLLDADGARRAGGWYAESEFHMGQLLAHRQRLLEVGRTCIHPAHRNGAVLGALWTAIGGVLADSDAEALLGCASISLDDPGAALAAERVLLARHQAPVELRVEPRHPLPRTDGDQQSRRGIPPLLQAYLRMGALVCGPAYWDRDFNVADVLVLLDRDAISARYRRHFLGA